VTAQDRAARKHSVPESEAVRIALGCTGMRRFSRPSESETNVIVLANHPWGETSLAIACERMTASARRRGCRRSLRAETHVVEGVRGLVLFGTDVALDLRSAIHVSCRLGQRVCRSCEERTRGLRPMLLA
jgi:hypothetical protein